MLLKNERDSTIQNIFFHYNLGNVPSTPFSTEVVLNLTNRIKSRLGELEMDLLDKKKSNETALSTAWDCYMDANDRWKSIEAQKRAKDEIKVLFTIWNSNPNPPLTSLSFHSFTFDGDLCRWAYQNA
jgi:DNA repair protein RAD50